MLYIFIVFTWFCPCFQCKDCSTYPHFPDRENGMLFLIVYLVSLSHAFNVAVINWRAFGSSLPLAWKSRLRYHEHFVDNCLHAGCSILCGTHSADETQSGRNSCPEFAFLT